MVSGGRCAYSVFTLAVGTIAVLLAFSQTVPMASAKPHKQLMIPGPIEVDEDVLAAAGGLPQSHVDPDFVSEFGETIELLRKVFFSANGQPFVVAGSGTLGWDMVASNLIEAGEHVLVINTGYFGDRFGDSLEAFQAKVTHLRAAKPGDRPSLQDIEAALKAAPAGGYKAVTITHVDTSTAVYMDVKSISEVIHRVSPSSLVIVDGVCSVGGEELKMDDWGVDVALTASQKALGAPPGLCIVTASERAMSVLSNRQTAIPNYYASWKKWLPIMKAYEDRKAMYFATPAVQLVQSLRVSLKQILSETPNLDDRFAKHRQASDHVKETIKSWGLQMVPTAMDHAAHTLTAVYLPEGLTPAMLLPKMIARGVMVAGGLHAEIGTKYFRLGHMGVSVMNDSKGHIPKMLQALKESLTELGYTFPSAKDEL